MRSQTYADPVAAFVGARTAALPGDRIVVFGSFFVVGDILGFLEDEGAA
jgi:folylpolyglutamate synthase/dihydropteroate synthase